MSEERCKLKLHSTKSSYLVDKMIIYIPPYYVSKYEDDPIMIETFLLFYKPYLLAQVNYFRSLDTHLISLRIVFYQICSSTLVAMVI